VHAVDINQALVDIINSGVAPWGGEPSLPELLAEHVGSGRLRATIDGPAAVRDADVALVVVPVLVRDDGSIADKALVGATETLIAGAHDDLLVILETTVPIGTTRELVAKVAAKSGAKVFGCFSPERVLTGQTFRNLAAYPKLVGGTDAPSLARATAFYESVLDAPIAQMQTLEAAEMAKLAETTYRDVNIALANEFARVADRHGIGIVEDACHAVTARYKGTCGGHFSDAACFSLHPLKNLNVWGDGGFVVTNSQEMHDKLVLMRNHGLINRDECAMFAYNSRLDTLQAIVANHLLDKLPHISSSRIEHATFLDQQLSGLKGLTVPQRRADCRQVFHIYCLRSDQRNELVSYLIGRGIDAKVHYPIPMHLQPAAKEFGYKRGDFPNAEAICDSVFSLPVHEFVTQEELAYTVECVKEFVQ
jgi:hypothetical protein